MRCPDCNKFVPFADPEAEVESEDIDSDGKSLDVEVRVMLACGECGTELKENTFSFEPNFEHDCSKEEEDEEEAETGENQFELEEVEAEATDRMENKDRKGNTISNPRYMKRMIGAEIKATVKCNRCNETFEVTDSQEEQASAFNEM